MHGGSTSSSPELKISDERERKNDNTVDAPIGSSPLYSDRFSMTIKSLTKLSEADRAERKAISSMRYVTKFFPQLSLVALVCGNGLGQQLNFLCAAQARAMRLYVTEKVFECHHATGISFLGTQVCVQSNAYCESIHSMRTTQTSFRRASQKTSRGS